MVGLWLFGAHEENGFAQAAPRVVQFREEHVRCGNAAVVRGRRSERDEVGRRAHLSGGELWWECEVLSVTSAADEKKLIYGGGRRNLMNTVRDNICV